MPTVRTFFAFVAILTLAYQFTDARNCCGQQAESSTSQTVLRNAVVDLASDDNATRERATLTLGNAGDAALPLLEKFIIAREDFEAVWRARAIHQKIQSGVYFAERDLDLALNMAQRACELEPENSVFLGIPGEIHFCMGNKAESIEVLKCALENHLGNVPVRQLLKKYQSE